MALPGAFNLSSDIVSVRCTGSDTIFNIHENLLVQLPAPEPFLAAKKIGTVLDIDLPSQGFKHFAHWLYDGKLDDHGKHYDTGMMELISAHNVGRRLGCVGFRDVVLDGIIAVLRTMEDEGETSLEYFMDEWLQEFPSGAFGRRLLIDWMIYNTGCRISIPWEDHHPFRFLIEDGNADFVKDFARQALIAQGKEDFLMVAEDVELSMLLVLGFLDKQFHTGYPHMTKGAWAESPCKYHYHRELGRPCYKAEQ
ncbi:hypothetical protein LTR37_006498 [Vermiconidia calcicola]|uniref:Uncharacterized protein n=1 Tax=Vermiconidia calcicola TaxID=1690605 RepID=A0ACC3NIZ9_9PEZI|nr:hypothetical protein LTR37_006498 [Vermiconidia calcicola]